MIDKTQMKIPSSIRGGCRGPTKSKRWAVVVGGDNSGVFEKLGEGVICPYYGISDLWGRPLWYWDQSGEEFRTLYLLSLCDESPPRFACFVGTVTDMFPDSYRQWAEMPIDEQAWPTIIFQPPFFNLLGVPVIWALHNEVEANWYRTYDECKANFPDAWDPEWRSIED